MSEQVNRLYSRAEALGVGIGEACDRAGIARSTASRWRAGTEPRPHLLARVDAAITAIAQERAIASPTNGHAPPGEPASTSAILAELQQILAAARSIAEALGLKVP